MVEVVSNDNDNITKHDNTQWPELSLKKKSNVICHCLCRELARLGNKSDPLGGQKYDHLVGIVTKVCK